MGFPSRDACSAGCEPPTARACPGPTSSMRLPSSDVLRPAARLDGAARAFMVGRASDRGHDVDLLPERHPNESYPQSSEERCSKTFLSTSGFFPREECSDSHGL